LSQQKKHKLDVKWNTNYKCASSKTCRYIEHQG